MIQVLLKYKHAVLIFFNIYDMMDVNQWYPRRGWSVAVVHMVSDLLCVTFTRVQVFIFHWDKIMRCGISITVYLAFFHVIFQIENFSRSRCPYNWHQKTGFDTGTLQYSLRGTTRRHSVPDIRRQSLTSIVRHHDQKYDKTILLRN